MNFEMNEPLQSTNNEVIRRIYVCNILTNKVNSYAEFIKCGQCA